MRFTTTAVALAVCLLISQQSADAADPDGRSSLRHIACIGDSITCGHGLKEPKRDAYPAQLQQLLGRDWRVQALCKSGVTLLKHGSKPVWTTDEWKLAQEIDADVAIVQLGTNDTKEIDWRRHQDEFLDDYKSLIQSLRKKNPAVEVYLCLPPPLFRDRGKPWDTDAILAKQILPKIRRVAAEEGAVLVDVYAACSDLGAEFPDGVHPNATASKAIAATIGDVIRSHRQDAK